MRRGFAVVSSLLVALFVVAGSASAATVSYIDGNALWLSNLSGGQKKMLSGATPDGRHWTEQAQADNGKVVAVRREPGKIAPLNSFTLFGPTGKVLNQGSLNHESGWFSYAYPVSLDLTDDGVAVYGYSVTDLGYTSFDFGTDVRTVEKPFVLDPFKISGPQYPTLYHDRVIGHQDQIISAQLPSEQTPFGTDFSPFLQVNDPNADLGRADISANGTVIAIEIDDHIELYPIDKPATVDQQVGEGGCVLSSSGDASHVSLSQDGKDMVWQDDRGVVSAGVPDFSGADPCHLTRSPVVIAAGGEYPSIGGASLTSGGGTGGGGGGGNGGPVPTVPPIKAASLKKGIWVTVKVVKAGKVSIVAKVGRKVVASGSGRAKKAGKVKIKLRAVGAFRKRPQKLKGKTLVIKVTSAGKSKIVRRVVK